MFKFCLMSLIMMIIVQPAYAGDVLKAGTVLTKDSYVFSIEEAQELKITIEELEFKENKYLAIIEQHKELSKVSDEKHQAYIDLISIKSEQLNEYENLHNLDIERIKSLEKYDKISSLEKFGFLGLGIGATIGAILIADKIDDVIELQ